MRNFRFRCPFVVAKQLGSLSNVIFVLSAKRILQLQQCYDAEETLCLWNYLREQAGDYVQYFPPGVDVDAVAGARVEIVDPR